MRLESVNSSERLRTLDFLRGWAILGVIGVHCLQGFPSHIRVIDVAFGLGKFGVQLFFFVSAWTMCYMWNQRNGETQPVFKFYVRRLFRIAPLFWLAIPTYLLINGTSPSQSAPDGVGFRQVALTAFFLHGFSAGDISSIVPGGWTIAVEMLFYLLFPLIIRSIADRKVFYICIGFAIWLVNEFWFKDAATAVLSAHYNDGVIQEFLYLNFLNQAPIFFIGCYLYFAIRAYMTRTELGLFVLWLGVGLIARYFHHVRGADFLLVTLSLAAFVYAAIKSGLVFKPIEMLGQRSYAIYLIHFLVIHYLNLIALGIGPLALAVGFFLTVSISYVLSYFIYILIEKNTQLFVKRVTS